MLFLGFQYSFGQTERALEIFNNLTEYYTNSKKYSLSLTLSMFKLVGNTQILSEEYKIQVYKDGNKSKSKILGTEMFNYEDCVISVFENGKELVIRDNSQSGFSNGVSQLSNYSKQYNFSIINDNSSKIELKLIPKEEQEAKTNYSKILIKVDEKRNRILSQNLFLKVKVPFKKENGQLENALAMLKIKFEDVENLKFEVPPKTDFIKEDSKGTIIASKKYNNYLITDRRIN